MGNRIFIDTMYVVALVNENDEYHKRATELSEKYENSSFVTTEGVLLEIANVLARNYKEQAVEIIEYFLSSDDVEIVHLNPTLFDKAFERYKTYLDKTWSLVDCISFEVMKEKGLIDALTGDKHFEQAGLNPLMKEK
ncbi:MAG: PIN domain-containing protein [Calditrichaeota bacterium]|nr:MAG: PIN domain-containing protein [Calditrichota bacterium]